LIRTHCSLAAWLALQPTLIGQVRLGRSPGDSTPVVRRTCISLLMTHPVLGACARARQPSWAGLGVVSCKICWCPVRLGVADSGDEAAKSHHVCFCVVARSEVIDTFTRCAVHHRFTYRIGCNQAIYRCCRSSSLTALLTYRLFSLRSQTLLANPTLRTEPDGSTKAVGVHVLDESECNQARHHRGPACADQR